MTHLGHATTIGMRSHRIPTTWFTDYLIATWDKCRATDWTGDGERLVAHRYAHAIAAPAYISHADAMSMFGKPVETATTKALISHEAAMLMFRKPSAAVKPAIVQENDTWWK